jgi:hypothetical protein
MKTVEEVATLYNTYMDESEAYVDQVMAETFVMTPPSFEEMKRIINQSGGMRESGMRPFRDRARTIIRHNHSNYTFCSVTCRHQLARTASSTSVQKTIMAFANEKYRESRPT